MIETKGNLKEAAEYALGCLEPIAKLGHLPQGGESSGNWLHVESAAKQLRDALDCSRRLLGGGKREVPTEFLIRNQAENLVSSIFGEPHSPVRLCDLNCRSALVDNITVALLAAYGSAAPPLQTDDKSTWESTITTRIETLLRNEGYALTSDQRESIFRIICAETQTDDYQRGANPLAFDDVAASIAALHSKDALRSICHEQIVQALRDAKNDAYRRGVEAAAKEAAATVKSRVDHLSTVGLSSANWHELESLSEEVTTRLHALIPPAKEEGK